MSVRVSKELYDAGIEVRFDDGVKRRKQNSLILLYNKRFGISEDVRKLILCEQDSVVLNKALELLLEVSTKEQVLSLFG